MKVGLVGVGNMGSQMAKALMDAGFELTVYDIRKDAMNMATSLGAGAAASPREIAQSCEIVLMSLPTPFIVLEVVKGKNGLLSGAEEETVIIDLSTVGPSTTREAASVAKEKSVYYLDAPVLGRPSTCGKWTLPVGGDEQGLEKARPVLEVLAKRVLYVGESGSGNIIKLLNNLLFAVNNAAIAEVMSLGAKLGMNPKLVYDTIAESRSAAVSNLFIELVPKVLEGNFEAVFSVDLLYKDVDLALGMAEEQKVPMLMARSAQIVNEMARAKGFGQEDTAALIKIFEDMLNIKVRA